MKKSIISLLLFLFVPLAVSLAGEEAGVAADPTSQASADAEYNAFKAPELRNYPPGNPTIEQRKAAWRDWYQHGVPLALKFYQDFPQDPRRWEAPDRFDVRRNNRDNLGFGYGVHACVGRVLALLEAEALLGALAESIESFEAAGEPDPWMTTIGHGPIRLPIKAIFAH